MSYSRRHVIATLAAVSAMPAASTAVKYVRFRKGSTVAHGILEGESVREIRGDLFGDHKPASKTHKLADVTLLYPSTPTKVLAIGLNYKSHIGNRPAPKQPEVFYKPITCLQNPEEAIRIPAESKNTHYEGELVLVIGKGGANITEAQAAQHIFGVSCGNDVSERDWQNGAQKDLQWWRAKGADTFGPYGPCIARNVDYNNLMLETRLNGKSVQKQNTSDLLFGPAAIVSYISRYVTLAPGDLIYTGTPGSTQKMNGGDIVEVEIEGIGILRNKVMAAS
jgi:2-keto-4-pentenoate hydratase/2-oxohepta-3-ene-1,7-dioic acid hydratase in catechol pathway